MGKRQHKTMSVHHAEGLESSMHRLTPLMKKLAEAYPTMWRQDLVVNRLEAKKAATFYIPPGREGLNWDVEKWEAAIGKPSPAMSPERPRQELIKQPPDTASSDSPEEPGTQDHSVETESSPLVPQDLQAPDLNLGPPLPVRPKGGRRGSRIQAFGMSVLSNLLIVLSVAQVMFFLLTKTREILRKLDWWWTSLNFPEERTHRPFQNTGP